MISAGPSELSSREWIVQIRKIARLPTCLTASIIVLLMVSVSNDYDRGVCVVASSPCRKYVHIVIVADLSFRVIVRFEHAYTVLLERHSRRSVG